MAGDKTKARISDELLISELKLMYEEGFTNFGNCYERLRTRWQIMKQRALKMHDITFSMWAKEKQEARQAISTQAEQDRLKLAILNKNEALEILTKIAKGNGSKLPDTGKIIVPAFKDRVQAITTIADMEGWKAAKEVHMKLGMDIEESFE